MISWVEKHGAVSGLYAVSLICASGFMHVCGSCIFRYTSCVCVYVYMCKHVYMRIKGQRQGSLLDFLRQRVAFCLLFWCLEFSFSWTRWLANSQDQPVYVSPTHPGLRLHTCATRLRFYMFSGGLCTCIVSSSSMEPSPRPVCLQASALHSACTALWNELKPRSVMPLCLAFV